MRALLLAAGLGSRLRPLTTKIPKCLVPIQGKPLLEIWLDSLSDAGVGPCLVNTHYMAGEVENFVKQSRHQASVRTTFESELLGTAGTLIANIRFFQEQDGLLIHADNYCIENLNAFVAAHLGRPKGCEMTMMTFRTEEVSSCGIVELDEKNIVVGFHEKVANPPGNLANGAVYILSAELLRRMESDYPDAVDFSLEILPTLLGKIYSFETSEIFLDIGTTENYNRANELV